jgi:hypothetical protein
MPNRIVHHLPPDGPPDRVAQAIAVLLAQPVRPWAASSLMSREERQALMRAARQAVWRALRQRRRRRPEG